jgi:hypothetical protein
MGMYEMTKTLKLFSTATVMAMLIGSGARALGVEKQSAALDPASYTVQLFDEDTLGPDATGASNIVDTYVRLANADTTQATITVNLVGVPSGNLYSTVSYVLPAHGSKQIRSKNIVQTDGHITAYLNGDTRILMYLKSTSARTVFSLVNYNAFTGAFSDFTHCQFKANSDYSWLNTLAFFVHTSTIAQYPSTLRAFNPNGVPVALKIEVYNPNGQLIGSATGNTSTGAEPLVDPYDISALSISELESALNYHPSSSDMHLNVVVTPLTSNVQPMLYEHFVTYTAGTQSAVAPISTYCPITQ